MPKGSLLHLLYCLIVANTSLPTLPLHGAPAQTSSLKIEYVYETVRTGGVGQLLRPVFCSTVVDASQGKEVCKLFMPNAYGTAI